MNTPTSSSPKLFAVAVAVGPGEREVERVIDLAASLVAYERGPGWFVMVDDSPEQRGLDRVVALPAGWAAVSLPHPRHDRATTFKVGKGIISAVLAALKWIQANTDAAYVLKLDTDSLVINPFADKLAVIFNASPALGMVGACHTTPNGTPRDWSGHAKAVRRYFEPPAFDWKHPIASSNARRAFTAPPAAAAYEMAKTNPAFDCGEHCMGGGYAVSRTLLDRLAPARLLDDPMIWTGIDLPEDVTVGIHVRAVDMTFADNVAPGEVFGVRYRGLPFLPEELVAKGYSVIHAVKNDDRVDEATVREYFAKRRATV
jgi:hypothetical protein